jgi:hypothetical protein
MIEFLVSTHGTINNTKTIAKVDDQDLNLIHLSWYIGSKGYLYSIKTVKGTKIIKRLHRLIADRMKLDYDYIDFKDGSPLNCCRDNLIPRTRERKPLPVKKKRELPQLQGGPGSIRVKMAIRNRRLLLHT